MLIDILNYTSTLLTIDKYLEVDDSINLVLPNNRKNVAPLVLSIGIKNGFHVNVSLNIIRQTNRFLPSPDCKFGGVAFFKDSGKIFHEIECICQDFNSSLGINRNVYFFGPSVILILYWYKEYSEIKVALNISNTECQAIIVDPCAAASYCNPCTKSIMVKVCEYGICKYFCDGGDRTSCKRYLKQITKFTTIKLHTNANKQYGEPVHYIFSIPHETCVVFQFRKQLKPISISLPVIDNTKCDISLIPAPVTSGEASFSFITGQLDSELLDENLKTTDEPDLVFTNFPFDFNVIFQDNPIYDGDGCCINETKGIITKCNNVISASPLDYTSFLMVSESKSYLYTYHSIAITHRTMPSSQDWVDIMVLKTKTKEKRQIVEYIPLSTGWNYIFLTKVSDRLEDVLYLTALGVHANDSFREYSYDIQIDCNDYYHYSRSFHWYSELKLFQRGYAISLPEKMSDVILISDPNQHLPRVITIKASWLSNNYRNISKQSNLCEHEPYSIPTGIKCLNFSLSGLKRNYLYFQESYPDESKLTWKINSFKNLVSWKETSDLCREAGGYLPIFRSRNELEELISLMKLSEDINPHEAIYIGLNFKNKEKVN